MDVYDAAWEFGHRTGVQLVPILPFAQELVIDKLLGLGKGAYHVNSLFGPYRDPASEDFRLFINYCQLEGFHSMQLLVQDVDDCCFLNSGAAGAERYSVRAQWRRAQPASPRTS